MKWALRACVGLAVIVTVAFVTIGRSEDGLHDALSDDGVERTANRGPAYLVEIADRPDYRLVKHDLDTGVITPLFIVGATGVISSVDHSPVGESLVLAYTTDYTVPGTGLYLLPTTGGPDGEPDTPTGGEELLIPISPERPGGFF